MRYSGVCTTMWAVFPSASTVVLPTLGRPAGDEQKALPGALSPLGGTLVTLTIPDILEERCTTRQALERLASKWRVLLNSAPLAGPPRPAAMRRRVEGIRARGR